MTLLLRIAERVLNRPLLVHPDKLPLLMAVLQGRIPIGAEIDWRAEADMRLAALPPDAQQVMRGPLPDASRFEGSFSVLDENGKAIGELPYRRTKKGTAVLPILGALVNRGYSAEPGSLSKASYEALNFQVQHAEADDNTTSALLDLQSPGGEAIGAFELASAVRALAAKKPVTAVVNGMACSAAYAIASGATRIVTTPTGLSGSIGVVMLHADFSRALDKEGITPTLIFAGAHKVDGHPFAPLPDGVREDLQREVNVYYDQFVQTVAAGRRSLSPAMIRATEARTFIGADAVEQGLADSVGTFASELADLSRGSGRILPSTPTKGSKMDNAEGEVAATAATVSKATHDAAVTASGAAGKTEGAAEGAKAAQARIKAILGAEQAKGREGLAQHLAFETDTPVDAALALLDKSPKASATPSIEQRMEGQGAALALGGPIGSRGPDPSHGWDAAAAAVNKQYGLGK